MASMGEYLEKMDSGQLDYILPQEMYGRNQYPLSTLYLICVILSEKDPTRGTPRDIFLEFTRSYADHVSLL